MTRRPGWWSLSSLAVLVVLVLCACAGPERVLCAFAGTAARAHTASAASYSHYSLLRTIEEAWGLAPLTGADAAAEPMDDLLVR